MEDFIDKRCGWAGTDDLYVKYYDEEWGKLVTDDRTLFEFFVLESVQVGLAWITILRKREGDKKAICYAHMQVAGFVNDHLEGCFCREKSHKDCPA